MKSVEIRFSAFSLHLTKKIFFSFSDFPLLPSARIKSYPVEGSLTLQPPSTSQPGLKTTWWGGRSGPSLTLCFFTMQVSANTQSLESWLFLRSSHYEHHRICELTGQSTDWPLDEHEILFLSSVKPSQPALTVLGSAADSVEVSWRSRSYGSCRLRYRSNHTHMWTKVSATQTLLSLLHLFVTGHAAQAYLK